MRAPNPIRVLSEGSVADLDGLARAIVLSRDVELAPPATFYACGTALSDSGTVPMAPYDADYVLGAEAKLIASALGVARFSKSLGWKESATLTDALALLVAAASNGCPDPYCNRYELHLLAIQAADGTSGYVERLLADGGYDYPSMLRRDEYAPVVRYLEFNRSFPESGEVPSMALLAADDARGRLSDYINELVGLAGEQEREVGR